MAGIPMQEDTPLNQPDGQTPQEQQPEFGSGIHPDVDEALAHELALASTNPEDELARIQDLKQGPFLSTLGHNLPALRQRLDQLIMQEADIEQAETNRAGTPLALTFQVVSCRWGTEHYSDDKTLPVINVQSSRCPKRLSTTNQDCRDCAFVKLIPYGVHEPAHERRYHDHGMIIPVSSENEAEKLASVLGAINMKPLRRVAHEIEAVKTAIQNAELMEAQARMQNYNLRRAQGADR